LELWRLAEESTQPMITDVPGFRVETLVDETNIWFYERWKDGSLHGLPVEEIAQSAMAEFRQFFKGVQPLPANIVIGPADTMIKLPSAERGVFSGEISPSLDRVAVYQYWRGGLRHELFHIIHTHALLPAQPSESVPNWVGEGLACYFEPVALDNPITINRLIASAQVTTPDSINAFPRVYDCDLVMIAYLMEHFGGDRIVRYAVHPRGLSVDQDALTSQYFGLNQMEILKESVETLLRK